MKLLSEQNRISTMSTNNLKQCWHPKATSKAASNIRDLSFRPFPTESRSTPNLSKLRKREEGRSLPSRQRFPRRGPRHERFVEIFVGRAGRTRGKQGLVFCSCRHLSVRAATGPWRRNGRGRFGYENRRRYLDHRLRTTIPFHQRNIS